ncbi:hypothetical protein DENSPDRAFT_266517 [Dentipellis sp. KUC8613]|nr:hypothetical protein DENSPDRAFT_266517 [Dentipellis sp. KUC8613]
MFGYIGEWYPAVYLDAPYDLAERAPDNWSYEDAVEEAHRAIAKHRTMFYPEWHEDADGKPLRQQYCSKFSCLLSEMPLPRAHSDNETPTSDLCTTDRPSFPSDLPTTDSSL